MIENVLALVLLALATLAAANVLFKLVGGHGG